MKTNNPKKYIKKFGSKVSALSFAKKVEGELLDLRESPTEREKYKCKFIVIYELSIYRRHRTGRRKGNFRRVSDLFPVEQDFNYPNEFWQ